MSTIKKRTVFVDTSDGYYRFHDWARVITPLGTMAEPFCEIGARKAPDTGFVDFDFTDEMSRIDEIEGISMDKEKLILSGGDEVIHGGYLMPRDGR